MHTPKNKQGTNDAHALCCCLHLLFSHRRVPDTNPRARIPTPAPSCPPPSSSCPPRPDRESDRREGLLEGGRVHPEAGRGAPEGAVRGLEHRRGVAVPVVVELDVTGSQDSGQQVERAGLGAPFVLGTVGAKSNATRRDAAWHDVALHGMAWHEAGGTTKCTRS